MKTSIDSWIPKAEDELLLDIVMKTKTDLHNAFNEWRKLTEWSTSPGRVYSLLPSVFYCLKDCDLQDIDRHRLAGVARKVALMNQMIWGNWELLIIEITGQGIDCWVTGELLIVLMNNDAARLKPIHKLELAVSSERYQDVLDILTCAGWITKSSKRCVKQTGRCQFNHDKIPAMLILTLWNDNDDLRKLITVAWAKLNTNSAHQTVVSDFDMEDIIAGLCLKGVMGRTEPQLNWILDVYWLLQAYPHRLDWQLIAERFMFIGLTWHGLQALNYLHYTRRLSIPEKVLNVLSQIPISRRETLLYKYGMRHSPLARIVFHWHLSAIETSGQGRLGVFLSKIFCRLRF